MAIDLSYINEQPSEAQEKAIREAVEKECLKAIAMYLSQIADTMDTQKIETLNVPTIRAMALEMKTRAEAYEVGNEA